MAKINNQQPQAPAWPWGPPAEVRERLVGPAQVDRRKVNQKGNPKNPPLASAALMDFIGPAHSSDELRLPLPELPPGHDADLDGFLDRPHLLSLARRADHAQEKPLELSLDRVSTSDDRRDRMRALLAREAQMLELLQQVHHDVREIDQKRREEQRGEEI